MRNNQLEVLGIFDSYFGADQRLHRIDSVPLLAAHDKTLRFTNSTTSVMRERIKNKDNGYFLMQPAIGSQGLNFWKSQEDFGPYASYFVSQGATYDPDSLFEANNDALSLLKNWGFNFENLTLRINREDYWQFKSIEDRIQIVVDDKCQDDYRHSYGENSLYGINGNYHINGGEQAAGNLTIIFFNNRPASIELSFDSTTITALLNCMIHPVFSHFDDMSRRKSHEEIARRDFLSVVSALSYEGLEPVSRGAQGLMRKFLLEYISLSRKINMSPQHMVSEVRETCETEHTFRKLGNLSISHNQMEPPTDIGRWIIKLADKYT